MRLPNDRSKSPSPPEDSDAGRRAGRDDGSIPPDLAGIDRLLGSILQPSDTPSGLTDRIFEASRSHLPAPVVGRILPRTNPRLRWARIAFAAAAVLAVAAGTVISFHGLGGDELLNRSVPVIATGPEDSTTHTDILPGTLPSAEPETAGAPETTLVALLDGGARGSSAEWMADWADDRSFDRTEAARAVAPVLQTRGAGIEEVADELGFILGVGAHSREATPSVSGPIS